MILLTNNDATLLKNERNRQPDAATISDLAGANSVNDKMMQSANKSDEINPKYGDAVDPTFETI